MSLNWFGFYILKSDIQTNIIGFVILKINELDIPYIFKTLKNKICIVKG